jgi:hypothetical protein
LNAAAFDICVEQQNRGLFMVRIGGGHAGQREYRVTEVVFLGGEFSYGKVIAGSVGRFKPLKRGKVRLYGLRNRVRFLRRNRRGTLTSLTNRTDRMGGTGRRGRGRSTALSCARGWSALFSGG